MHAPLTLAARLDRSLDEILHGFADRRARLAERRDLATACERVVERFGSWHNELVTSDRIAAAWCRLAGAGGGSSARRQLSRDLFVLAHSLTQRLPELEHRSLVASPKIARVLHYWEGDLAARRLRATHWRGLFHSYLQIDTSEEGFQAQTLVRLRRLLSAGLDQLIRGPVTRPWMRAAFNHRCLLEDGGALPYAQGLMRNDRSLLDDLLSDLQIPLGSWFWSAVLREFLGELDRSPDETFKSSISTALSLLTDHATMRAEVLCRLLNRYARCSDTSKHQELLTAALDVLGSPQLQKNLKWGLVDALARRMVCGWLALEDLTDFFELCQEDGRADPRRLAFWKDYVGQVEYSQILLGTAAANSSDPDLRDFKRRKKDRLGRLRGAGSGTNAFLMVMNGHLVVEFSAKGNACYSYTKGQHDIGIGQREHDARDLRERKKGTQHRHVDAPPPQWEIKFSEWLRAAGITPDSGIGALRARYPHKAAASATARSSARRSNTSSIVGTKYRGTSAQSSRVRHAGSQDPPWTDTDRDSLLRQGARIVDNRHKGGCLWVFIGSDSRAAERSLQAFGFRHKPNKGWYFE